MSLSNTYTRIDGEGEEEQTEELFNGEEDVPEEAKIYTCRKGSNSGRKFYAIFNPPEVQPRTRYFKWIDEKCPTDLDMILRAIEVNKTLINHLKVEFYEKMDEAKELYTKQPTLKRRKTTVLKKLNCK